MINKRRIPEQPPYTPLRKAEIIIIIIIIIYPVL
jgi:hypothetical protein